MEGASSVVIPIHRNLSKITSEFSTHLLALCNVRRLAAFFGRE